MIANASAGRAARLRTLAARIVVVVGIALAAVGLVTARWALLVVGIVLVGLGAAIGPARIRKS